MVSQPLLSSSQRMPLFWIVPDVAASVESAGSSSGALS